MPEPRATTMTWGARAGKKARCALDCTFSDIALGEPVIRTSVKFQGRSMIIRKIWHPLCWLDNTLAYIETLPIPHKQHGMSGRPRIAIDAEQRKARTKLSTRMNRVRTEKEFAISRGWWWKVEALDIKVAAIREEYMTLGGVPSTWPS